MLINNASVGLRGHLPVDAFDWALQVNLKIPFLDPASPARPARSWAHCQRVLHEHLQRISGNTRIPAGPATKVPAMWTIAILNTG
ncbi:MULTISPECIES: hypothetical protein [Achromobacter]|jgi:hypothetical protein|uniref:Short chain dehydrogenase n=1 Tax=Achromobacter aegrifaciens TaxID=1287736 RepID=A0ABU2DKJ2_ACHAE|nr:MULTISPECIES: hypothetical protein [Achromobacter]MBD9380048.1 hypothetical protein [Achromobacter sp. ACM02]MBD9428819.1 hypothetical protein [Achromobacter sp. ACM03]MDR7948452.1 hypothetical protein [Achromobacter aegrifaciens]